MDGRAYAQKTGSITEPNVVHNILRKDDIYGRRKNSQRRDGGSAQS